MYNKYVDASLRKFLTQNWKHLCWSHLTRHCLTDSLFPVWIGNNKLEAPPRYHAIFHIFTDIKPTPGFILLTEVHRSCFYPFFSLTFTSCLDSCLYLYPLVIWCNLVTFLQRNQRKMSESSGFHNLCTVKLMIYVFLLLYFHWHRVPPKPRPF